MRDERTVNPAEDGTRATGCASCAGYGRPGYVSAWVQEGENMRHTWRRCPDHCTAATRAAAIAHHQQLRAQRQNEQAQTPAPRSSRPQAPVQRSQKTTPTPAKTSKKPRGPRAAGTASPLLAAVALDLDGAAVVADVEGVSTPGAKTLDALLRWIASGPALGIAATHKDGRRHNGTVVLSSALCRALKIPAQLPTTEGKRTALRERLDAAAQTAGVDLGHHLSARIPVMPRKAVGVRRAPAVTLVVTPWLGQAGGVSDAADDYLTSLAPDGSAADLARRLRAFAGDLGVPATATPGVIAMRLLDSVTPREEWVGDGERELKPGALPAGDVCVPPAAGGRHPLTAALLEREQYPCRENDYTQWQRDLTPEEAALPWAIGVDVAASHLSVTGTLPLPVGPLKHTTEPEFSKKQAGLWRCDFSEIETEDLLPHPATKTGQRPSGPDWYATPTVDYMISEYGYDPAEISEAYVSTHTAPALKQWTATLRDAYKRQMAVLGVTDGMEPTEFITAYAHRTDGADEDQDRADAAKLIDAYKRIYRAATGKWADRGGGYEDDQDWLAEVVTKWHYRPEIRLHIVAAARIGTHRRIRKTHRLTGRAPFSANVDALLYACEDASPLPLLPQTEDGKPVPGTLRLGAAPGSVKWDKTIPMDDVQAAITADRPLAGASGLSMDYNVSGLVHQDVDDEGANR